MKRLAIPVVALLCAITTWAVIAFLVSPGGGSLGQVATYPRHRSQGQPVAAEVQAAAAIESVSANPRGPTSVSAAPAPGVAGGAVSQGAAPAQQMNSNTGSGGAISQSEAPVEQAAVQAVQAPRARQSNGHGKGLSKNNSYGQARGHNHWDWDRDEHRD